MNTAHRILVITDYEAMKKQLAEELVEYSDVHFLTSLEVKKEIDRIAPQIVLLVQPEDSSEVELVQYIHAELQQAMIIFITDKQDFLLLRDIMRAGALEYILMPEELNLLTDRIDKISLLIDEQSKLDAPVKSGKSFVRGRGKVFSFYSGKGGSGRTQLATAFAQSLKLESTAQVLLIDLNLQFGGAETFLSLDNHRTIADLMSVMAELNENNLRNIAQREKHSKLEVLLSPCDAETAENISEEFVARVIRSARRSYDFIIIDLPNNMSEITYSALEESDMIYYVLNLDTPSVQAFKHVETLFRKLGVDTEGRLELLVNQVGRDNELNVFDLKKIIHIPVAAEIKRDHRGVQAAVNQGLPLQKQANEKKLTQAAKDIRKWTLKMLS
ncbi:AAA family ATPase [Bacillus tianshenii]|nr:AAA family ATPase [Bacillus tianshenii]